MNAMLEDIEGIVSGQESRQDGLNASQMEYLTELDANETDWSERNEFQQQFTLSLIDGRMEELGISPDQRSELAHSILSDDIADSYDDYIVETYGSGGYESVQIEAPQDHVQIEQVSEAIAECDEIKYENWVELELSEKEAVLNSIEVRIAEIEHRPPCPIRLEPLGERVWGGYNPDTKEITLNSDYVQLSDRTTHAEVIDTLVHEGRHAYQDYNVNVCEIHPRHSEVESWAETMGGGKWEYWGDCSSILGQRLYEQQSIEIDARNFATDVLDKLNLNA